MAAKPMFCESQGIDCNPRIIHNEITNINAWDSSFSNVNSLRNSINKTLLLTEMVSVSYKMYYLQYSDPFAMDFFMATNNLLIIWKMLWFGGMWPVTGNGLNIPSPVWWCDTTYNAFSFLQHITPTRYCSNSPALSGSTSLTILTFSLNV